MSKLSTESGKNALVNRNWEELYILAKHWKSDLEFYKDDLRFLHNLIDKYLIWITRKENLESVALIRKKEHRLTLRCNELYKKVCAHLEMAANIVKGGNGTLTKDFFTTHGELEIEIATFVKSFRENRKEVFRVTEYVMDSEELRNLLDS